MLERDKFFSLPPASRIDSGFLTCAKRLNRRIYEHEKNLDHGERKPDRR
jgi:hypothetical protein